MFGDKIKELLNLIDESNRGKCLKMYEENKERFDRAPGSSVKHQAWEGGYMDHVTEVMNFARALYNLMHSMRPLPFTLSDALLVLYLHDLEKPFKYIEPKIEMHDDKEKEDFIQSMIKKYDIILKDIHLNALKYVHGEGNDFSKTERVQWPLAAFVHLCDITSARIWFDYPKRK